MAVESVLPSLSFVEALIRSGHDLLEDVVDGGAAAVGGNSPTSASSSNVAVAPARASVVDIAILRSQMAAACQSDIEESVNNVWYSEEVSDNHKRVRKL